MTATVHVLIGGAVGVAVGQVTQNPVAGLAVGVASHFVADLIPHVDHPPAPKRDGELVWTPTVWVFAFVDSIAAALLTLLFWYSFFMFPLVTPFVLGAIGGYLPDFIDNVPFWKHRIRKVAGFKQFHRFHEALHHIWQSRFPMPEWWILGIATQLVAITISLWYLVNA